PRWASIMTLAPASRAARIVGSAASRRWLEVITLSLMGALRSSRINTRWPDRSRSLMRLNAMGGLLGYRGRHHNGGKAEYCPRGHGRDATSRQSGESRGDDGESRIDALQLLAFQRGLSRAHRPQPEGAGIRHA